MTPTSSGGNQNIGRPPEPTPLEMEATAATQVNRAATGIAPDSIDLNFTLLNPPFNFGYIGGFGYRTTAGRPLLYHTLENTRMLNLGTTTPAVKNQAIYDELVRMLPPDLQQRLQSNNSNFMALNDVLNFAASVLAQADIASRPAAPESLEEARTALNLLLPFAVLQGSLDVGNSIGAASLGQVTALGPNFPAFDSLNNILNGMQVAISNLNKVSNNLGDTVEKAISPEIRSIAEKAAGQFSALTNQLETISLGDDLQILLPTLTALQTTAMALSLPNIGSAPLFIGLSIALIGLSMGPSFDAAVSNLTDAMVPQGNLASQQFFALMVTTSLAALASLSALGAGSTPTEYFAYTAAVQMALGAGVLDSTFSQIIAAAGGEPTPEAVKALTLAALMTIILTSAQKVKQSANAQIEDDAQYLHDSIVAAEELTAQIKNDTIKSSALSVALTQARIALDEKNYQGVIDACSTVLESLDSSLPAFLKDLSAVSTDAGNIAYVTGQGDPNQSLTNIINVV